MTANDSWRNINDLYFRIPKVDKRKNVVEVSDEEEYVAEEEEHPQVKLLEGKFLPGEDGFQFNKKCILQVKGKYLGETPRKKVTFDTFVEFDGEEENLCQQVEADLNDECITEAEAMLFYGEKYSQAMRGNPDAKCYYKFKAHNNACRNDVESELLEMPFSVEATLKIKLYINTDDPDVQDDTYRLYSSDFSYDKTLTVKDDKTPKNDALDLQFENIDDTLSYSLEIDPGNQGEVYTLFENKPFKEILDE